MEDRSSLESHDEIEVRPTGPVDATVRPPGSKSITNRSLVCAALAEGKSVLEGALDSEDTRVMVDGLARLGLAVRHDATAHRIEVTGYGGRIPAMHAELFAANSGTTIRFLTAVASLGKGQFRLVGVERMRERPIGELVDALNQLGADIRCERDNGCPPVLVQARGLAGGRVTMKGDVSSQFVSAVLLAAPYANADVELAIDGPLVSRPYVDMTLGVMSAFGASANHEAHRRFHVAAGRHYRGRKYTIEPDASAASYFWAAAAITEGRVTVAGLTRHSLQGDVAFCDCLAQMGCRVIEEPDGITVEGQPLHGIEVDMRDISDTAQTLAAVALLADGPTSITGVGHIRHKETDRIADLARELRKLGATVDELSDGLRIMPGALHGAAIDTYRDHRMAMSLAVVGLRVSGVVIRDPGCTAKTYPRFFDDLAALSASHERSQS